MRIGIVTYHKAHNYGAMLQTVATKTYFSSLGAEVRVINYWPPSLNAVYKLFPQIPAGTVFSKVKWLIFYVIRFPTTLRRFLKFKRFENAYLEPVYSQEDEKFDVVLYGSDQIWRCERVVFSGMPDPFYFGQNNLQTKRSISFAVSAGNLIRTPQIDDFYRRHLPKFDVITVRERQLQDYCAKLGFVATRILDPVFLLSSSEWDRLLNINRLVSADYALLYRLHDTFDMKKIKAFCRARSLRLIVISGCAKSFWKGERSGVCPQEFVSLVKHASFVFSSSFHGMAFSLIYQKDFCVSFSNETNWRAQSLLLDVGLETRLIDPYSDIVTSHIDYSKTMLKQAIDENLCEVQKLGVRILNGKES